MPMVPLPAIGLPRWRRVPGGAGLPSVKPSFKIIPKGLVDKLRLAELIS